MLLDPYAQCTSTSLLPRACSRPGPTDGRAPLGVLARAVYDWGDHRRPRHASDLIIYELHVKGFTARPSSGVSPEQRGTFAGLKAKIPYLVDLGVTVVELLPVQQFDPDEATTGAT